MEVFGDGPWAMFFPRHRLMPALLLVRWHPLQGLRFWKRGLHWSLLCQSGRGSQCEYSLRQAQGIRPQMSQKHRICHAFAMPLPCLSWHLITTATSISMARLGRDDPLLLPRSEIDAAHGRLSRARREINSMIFIKDPD